MKRYKAYATISYDLVCEFEMDDEDFDSYGDDSWAYAKDMLDGADFKELDGSSDWTIYEVEEIKEKENGL